MLSSCIIIDSFNKFGISYLLIFKEEERNNNCLQLFRLKNKKKQNAIITEKNIRTIVWEHIFPLFGKNRRNVGKYKMREKINTRIRRL